MKEQKMCIATMIYYVTFDTEYTVSLRSMRIPFGDGQQSLRPPGLQLVHRTSKRLTMSAVNALSISAAITRDWSGMTFMRS